MKKLARIVGAWAFLWALCAACGMSDGTGGGGGSAQPQGPAVPVDACAVDAAYRRNEVAARQQYPEAQHVLVSGTVDNVAVSLGTTVVHARPCMLATIRLRDDQSAAAANLNPGQPFQADCTTGGYMMGISFENCRLQP